MKTPITIELLEVLDAIDRRGSFAKAAQELNKATSAISYLIQKSEEQLGAHLFERQGRRSILTPAGQLMLEEGRQILTSTRKLERKTRELATGWEPRLRIGIDAALDDRPIFDVLEGFLREHPHTEIEVHECVLNGGWDLLTRDMIDLAIGAPGPVPLQMGFRAVPLAQNDMLPVVSVRHPLASALIDPILASDAVMQVRRVIQHDTSEVGIGQSAGLADDGRCFYVQTMDQKLAAVAAGLGAGHLPRHRIQHYLDDGSMKVIAVPSAQFKENFMAWRISHKGRAMQRLTSAILAS